MLKKIALCLLMFSNLQAQTKDCCDSIKETYKIKKNYQKSLNSKKHDIFISIDNSNSANNCNDSKKCSSNDCTKSEPKIEPNENENKFINNDLFRNILTIILALIAGLIALYQMKLNMISSARIRWIEELKELLSKLYPEALNTHMAHTNCSNAGKRGDKKEVDIYYLEYSTAMSNFNTLSNKIKMHLNSNEIEHRNIEEIIDRIDSFLSSTEIEKTTQQEIEKELKEIVKNSKIIFKKEWDKSKKLFKI